MCVICRSNINYVTSIPMPNGSTEIIYQNKLIKKDYRMA